MRRLLDLGAATGAGVAAVASGAAGICCVGPLGLALLGVQGSIFAAGLQPYRGWLLAGAGLLLAGAHWTLGRRERACRATEGSCPPGRLRWSRRAIWAASVLWLLSLGLPLITGLFGY